MPVAEVYVIGAHGDALLWCLPLTTHGVRPGCLSLSSPSPGSAHSPPPHKFSCTLRWCVGSRTY